MCWPEELKHQVRLEWRMGEPPPVGATTGSRFKPKSALDDSTSIRYYTVALLEPAQC